MAEIIYQIADELHDERKSGMIRLCLTGFLFSRLKLLPRNLTQLKS